MTEPSDKLLDLIYDAAAEPELWRSVLTEIADLTNSSGGVLHGQSIGANELYFSYNGRCDDSYNNVYRERHLQNPWAVFMESQPVGRIVFSDEVTELASLRRTLFFDELLRPQDVPHNAMIALAAKEGFRAAFNLCRSTRQGPFGEEERRFLQLLAPHMRRAIGLSFRVDAYRALQRASFDVLDRLSAGVIVLDRRGRITYANAAARAVGSDDGPLRLSNGAVTASSSSAHSQRLGELIRLALRGAAASSMSLPHPADGRLLTILVSSVRGRDVGRFADLSLPDAAVLLFIVDPTSRAEIPIAWVMDAYGLTQAEARVALAASQGLTVAQAAIQLDVSPNTVKTHLRRIYEKTGTSRQAELSRLITAIGLVRDSRTDS